MLREHVESPTTAAYNPHGPPACNTRPPGDHNHRKYNEQGCGYYYTDSKCQMVGGALMCQGEQVGTGGCMGSGGRLCPTRWLMI